MKLPMIKQSPGVATAAMGLCLVACSASSQDPSFLDTSDGGGAGSHSPPSGADGSAGPPTTTGDGGPDHPTSNDGSPGQSPDGSACPYTSDAEFCTCLGQFNCGGATVQDSTGTFQSVYCGSCPSTQFCTTSATDVFIGQCGGNSPLTYAWQSEKIDMLVAMGENDNTDLNYDYCENIGDGRGYTIGKVGFCSGTGDFVIVAACYNDLEPNNILSKYWPALVYYADEYITLNANQGDTSKLDAIGPFCTDVATAAADPVFTGCQDAIAIANYMSPAAAHATQMHLGGPLTIGFLYDTELNFGEDDDPPTPSGKPGTPGAKHDDHARELPDYGAGLPHGLHGEDVGGEPLAGLSHQGARAGDVPRQDVEAGHG